MRSDGGFRVALTYRRTIPWVLALGLAITAFLETLNRSLTQRDQRNQRTAAVSSGPSGSSV
jgi:hypothetical protein